MEMGKEGEYAPAILKRAGIWRWRVETTRESASPETEQRLAGPAALSAASDRLVGAPSGTETTSACVARGLSRRFAAPLPVSYVPLLCHGFECKEAYGSSCTS